MNKSDDTIWDVVVVGGGPAGMMAASQAAKRGLSTILVEKNSSLGKKLLITGGGRCNVTNEEFDNRKLLSKFKEADQFLFSAFAEFAVKDTLAFFHERGMETKTEALQRVFPKSNKSESVWNVLVDEMKKAGVTVITNSPVTGFVKEEGVIKAVNLRGGKILHAKNFILATGGKSRPETGSTGEGFSWLKTLGHTVSEPEASLVPVAIKDGWVKRLQGLSLPEVKVTTLQNGVKQDMRKGKILFTHFGVSGPTIINMSRDIGELLKYGDVTITLDVLPSLDHGMLNAKIQAIFKDVSNKKLKNSLSELMPAALSPVIIELGGFDGNKPCNSVTREERLKLIELLKHLPMQVEDLLDVDKAIVTSGGVDLKEVDFKTMRSKLFPNLYLIGDVLNIDRPSGGYSLQLCWTTGFVAGNKVEK
ncbi:MAG: aminoacetone oxidase family FAD-binding enzyme [Candidatus Paceibacterota bacterium]